MKRHFRKAIESLLASNGIKFKDGWKTSQNKAKNGRLRSKKTPAVIVENTPIAVFDLNRVRDAKAVLKEAQKILKKSQQKAA